MTGQTLNPKSRARHLKTGGHYEVMSIEGHAYADLVDKGVVSLILPAAVIEGYALPHDLITTLPEMPEMRVLQVIVQIEPETRALGEGDVAIYTDAPENRLAFLRPVSEFMDGRFEILS